MSDRALSMSLDDYIKDQRKLGKNKGGRPGQGRGAGSSSRGKSTVKNTRYFVRGGGAGGFNRPRGGGPRPKQQQLRGNKPIVARGRTTQFAGRGNKRGGRSRNTNSRFNRPGTSTATSPRQTKRGSRQPNVARQTLTNRAQRFGGQAQRSRSQNTARREEWAGRLKTRKSMTRNRVRQPAAPIVRIPRDPRTANQRVRKLIQKRIQRARLTLTRKPARPLRTTLMSKKSPRILTKNARPSNRLQALLAQQKRARAQVARLTRNTRRLPVRPSSSRGLVLDRSNVRIHVRNDAASAFSFDSDPLYGFERVGLRSDEFAPRVLSNPRSEVFHQVLDPDIQKKIALIQNRARATRTNAEIDILPDFRGPVSSCRVNPGDRFRMLMN